MNSADLANALSRLDAADSAYATNFVERLLTAARGEAISDIHLQPVGRELDVRWRQDGVLQPIGRFPRGEASDAIARLKVLADLLTYKVDAPQEGRIRRAEGIEMRVSTFPTLHGERAVVRLFVAERAFESVANLGYPPELEDRLQKLLVETSGLLLVTGPAGSGKTTACYAMLRELAASPTSRSLVSLEDPIEGAIPGVAQCQVSGAAGFDLATGLKSLLRQDPEVIFVGEIRDRETAQTAFQASLTGHLVLSTFHAGSASEAIGRLAEMGIEPYLLKSGLLAIVGQRLLRRLCHCATPTSERLGLECQRALAATGCPDCRMTGYRGRLAIAEMLEVRAGQVAEAVAPAILQRDDARELERRAMEGGMIARWRRAIDAIESGHTSPQEVRRVMGFL